MTAVGIVSTILEDLIVSIKDSSTEYFHAKSKIKSTKYHKIKFCT